ncbi:hypothetical protein L6164_012244 [Bauhinia variegata]|uniref:Uncharacterized protein n=1 Tax=Bauhinia variegata TaxID=167791 RepID=A0ACB9P9G0_BAUVA|nr:hypothetical protein L6164_012244 [Bauhinia variegata]
MISFSLLCCSYAASASKFAWQILIICKMLVRQLHQKSRQYLSTGFPANIIAQDFMTTELSKAGSLDNIFGFSMNIVDAAKFPGLNTLGLSIGRIEINVDGQVFLHYHPRATEMIFVTKGKLVAGFLDTTNQLFQKFLKEGDVFVFSKGLFHFCLNAGSEVVTIISAFNSQNPRTVSIVDTKFATTLDSFISASQLHLSNNSTLLGSDNGIYSLPFQIPSSQIYLH